MNKELLNVLIKGDLSKLSPQEKVDYLGAVCKSVNLNPLTKPFDYIPMKGKLILYATKNCSDQLRKMHGVSIDIVERKMQDGILLITVKAQDKTGREDTDMGYATIANLTGDALGNSILKAVTKAKRRVTLSICGLGGILDETEIDDTSKRASGKQTAHDMTRTNEDVLTAIQGSKIPTYTFLISDTQNKAHSTLDEFANTVHTAIDQIIKDPDATKIEKIESINKMCALNKKILSKVKPETLQGITKKMEDLKHG